MEKDFSIKSLLKGSTDFNYLPSFTPGNAFSSDELLANQGIYSRVSKNAVLIGAAVAYGMKRHDELQSQIHEYNKKVDAAVKKYPNAVRVNTTEAEAYGVRARPAVKSELKNMRDESVSTISGLKSKLQNHIDAANDHASKSGDGLTGKVHAVLAGHHLDAAKEVVGKIKDEQKSLKEINNDLNDRYQVSANRESREAAAGVSVPKGTGKVGAQQGHPFYGNQHASGN